MQTSVIQCSPNLIFGSTFDWKLQYYEIQSNILYVHTCEYVYAYVYIIWTHIPTHSSYAVLKITVVPKSYSLTSLHYLSATASQWGSTHALPKHWPHICNQCRNQINTLHIFVVVLLSVFIYGLWLISILIYYAKIFMEYLQLGA